MSAPEKCPYCGAFRTIDTIREDDGKDYYGCGSARTRITGTMILSAPCKVRSLSASNDALRAELAEAKAQLAQTNSKLAELSEENLALNHRVEVEDADVIERLEAQLAASVTRDVAIDACNRAWGHGRMRFAGGGHVEHPVDPRRIFTHGTPESNAGEYAEARACSVACLARAEAEAATNAARAATIDQTPTEGTP